MCTKKEKSLLKIAHQRSGFAVDGIKELHSKCDDVYLAEHAYELLTEMVKIHQKIQRLLTLSVVEDANE